MPMPQIAAPAPTAPTVPSTVRAVRVAAGGTSRRHRHQDRGLHRRRRLRRCSRPRSPCCGSRRCRRRGWSRSRAFADRQPVSAVHVPSPTLPKPALRRAFLASSSERPDTSGTVRPSPLLGLIVTVVPPATLPAPGFWAPTTPAGWLESTGPPTSTVNPASVSVFVACSIVWPTTFGRSVSCSLDEVVVRARELVAAVRGIGRALNVPRDAVADVGQPNPVVRGLEDVAAALDVARPGRRRDLGAGLDEPRLELFVRSRLADERHVVARACRQHRFRRSSRPAARRPRSPPPSDRAPGCTYAPASAVRCRRNRSRGRSPAAGSTCRCWRRWRSASAIARGDTLSVPMTALSVSMSTGSFSKASMTPILVATFAMSQ